jgi:trans-2-enoyl-CoA reductase
MLKNCLNTFNVKELRLREFGKQSEESMELHEYDLKESDIKLNDNELFVKLIASPIDPADFIEIDGTYGTGPQKLPAIKGMEGVFEVIKVSNSSTNYEPGDWVLPVEMNWGTWRSHAIANENFFYKIPSNLDKAMCSMLKINPVTAYKMLTSFVELKPNDTVIQNGANGGVGQAVIQLGNLMNVNVVNVVRRRHDSDDENNMLNQMKDLGARYIFHEDELRSSKYLADDLWKEIPKPRLAFNCVGGQATADMVRLLDTKSTLVTYGGMAKPPGQNAELNFETNDFLFKDLRAVGFWVTDWRRKNRKEFEKVVDHLCPLISNKQLKPPKYEEFKLQDFRKALRRAQTPQRNARVIFVD